MLATLFIAIGRLCLGEVDADDLFAVPDVGQAIVRVILLFDFDRPMKWYGRALNATLLWLMKFTAFYQEPKKNLADFEARFEAATRRADENLEKLSD